MQVEYISSYNQDATTPDTGSRWVWEIDNDRARELIEVVEVKWNGEEWWIKTRTMPPGPKPMLADLTEPEEYWNDLSRFWEAVTPATASSSRKGT